MKKNNGMKAFFLTVALLTLAMFLAINLNGFLAHLDQTTLRGLTNNTLDWESRPIDLIILLFFLIGGALASLRVLPNRRDRQND